MARKTIADYRYEDFHVKEGGFDKNIFNELKELRKEVEKLKEEVEDLKT